MRAPKRAREVHPETAGHHSTLDLLELSDLCASASTNTSTTCCIPRRSSCNQRSGSEARARSRAYRCRRQCSARRSSTASVESAEVASGLRAQGFVGADSRVTTKHLPQAGLPTRRHACLPLVARPQWRQRRQRSAFMPVAKPSVARRDGDYETATMGVGPGTPTGIGP